MTDQTIPTDARKQAAKAVAFALGPMIPKREFDAAVLVDVALAATYPSLRQRIETEVRPQVVKELRAQFGVTNRAASWLARGAAQPGGHDADS